MKDIGKCKKWRILAYISVLGMLFACADQMLLDNENPAVRQAKNKNQELTVSVARQWFESKYTPVVPTRSVDGTERLQKPYWEKAKEHNRKRYEVVETPILSQGVHVVMDRETAAYWESGMKSDFIRNTIRMVVLRDKKKGTTRSFIMTFVGTLEYLKKTRTIGKNSYLYRQPDFSGSVLFHELDGTFMNGWRYSDGRIVGTLSRINGNKHTVKTSDANTRMLVEVCEDVCYQVYEKVCEEYYVATGDLESGIVLDIEEDCNMEYKGDNCVEYCSLEDDGYYEEEEEDNWWENDYPVGGADYPDPDVGNDNSHNTEESSTNIDTIIAEVKAILRNKGIDVDKYKIRYVEKNDMCVSIARILADNTIEVCSRFLQYNMNDRSSIIWHEIYHVDKGHSSTNGKMILLEESDIIHLTPDSSVLSYWAKWVRWTNGLSEKQDLTLYAAADFHVSNIKEDMKWYQNEIETYTAELNNGIPKTDHYIAEMNWYLWQYQQIYNVLKNK